MPFSKITPSPPAPRWQYRLQPTPAQIEALASQLNTSAISTALLLQRDMNSFEKVKDFFTPSLTKLHDPFCMKDMEKGVQVIWDAIQNKQKICVYGDYDVDGTTSVTLLYATLKSLGAKVSFYIPDRYKEGYGLSELGVQQAIDHDIKLLICVDCGTKAIKKITHATQAGIQVIVCDHHEPDAILPPVVAMLNPKQHDCPYPFKELSACGIVFKLLQAFVQRGYWSEKELYNQLDLVVLSIAADIVPMTGENRILAHFGLKKLHTTRRPSLQIMCDMHLSQAPPSISDVVFKLAPRINAAGRMGHAHDAVYFMLAHDDTTLEHLMQHIESQNSTRKEMDAKIAQEALEMIAEDSTSHQRTTTVLYQPHWHKGIIGIVASRCIEYHYKPTILLTEHNGKATGSARSILGYNLYKALKQCDALLTNYGGHAYAAGLTLPIENVPLLQEKFEQIVSQTLSPEDLQPTCHIDLRIELHQITPKLFQVIQRMAPFGPGHRRPVFSSEPVFAVKHLLYQEKHLKLYFTQEKGGKVWQAIGFNMAHCVPYVKEGKPFAIAYTLQPNHYQGRTSIQLVLKDLRPIA